MLPTDIKESLTRRIETASHPPELAVDVMFALQEHYGWLTDEAMEEAGAILGMNPMKLEELATFYTFLYREPVGKYVIHLCDSVICWMDGYESLRDHIALRLGISMGETTPDGLFTLLPVCCIGYCDRSPAMLINKKVYGFLTPEKIDAIFERLRTESQSTERGTEEGAS